MHIRPLDSSQDRRRVLDLLARSSLGTGGLSEAKVAYLESDDDRLGAGLVAEEDGSIVGYVGLLPAAQPGEWAMEVVAAPSRLAAALAQAGVEFARRQGWQRLRWWTYRPGWEAAAAGLGFAPERTLLRMERALPADPPQFPPGVEVASFRPGQDEEAWLGVNNAAFAGHPENSAMTMEELGRRLAYPWFEADGLRMAWRDGELAGFCWVKRHPDAAGEIYIIAVAPAHQGSGLGRALVLEGLRFMHRAGCRRAFLYTEGDNRPALSLYESLGFQVAETHRSYIRRLD